VKISWKIRTIAVAHVGALLIGTSVAAVAGDNDDIGKNEYDAACAVCHGRSGKGDGPMKSRLISPVPDLTVLAKNNNGVFPFDRIQKIIDGREEMLSHGTREMPIWGFDFNLKTSIYFKENPPYNTEYTVRSRILALTEYLYRLQAK
jgi:mono/diheme cytochrome c family protein